MAQAPVTPYVHETLDVHGHFGTQSTFHLEVGFDLLTKTIHVVVVQILGATVRIDPGVIQDLLRAAVPDPVDVGQGDFDPLPSGKINSCDTCHYPCRCLCRGFLLQMIRTTPRRRTTLQCSQIGFTLVLTFIQRHPVRSLHSLLR